jgi:hypothetical protein
MQSASRQGKAHHKLLETFPDVGQCDELKPCSNCARHGVLCSLVTWDPSVQPTSTSASSSNSSVPKQIDEVLEDPPKHVRANTCSNLLLFTSRRASHQHALHPNTMNLFPTNTKSLGKSPTTPSRKPAPLAQHRIISHS